MVMELFTKMPALMQELMLALMLLPAMLPLMLHLSGQEATVEHRKACVVSTIVQYSWCTIALQCLMWIINVQFYAGVFGCIVMGGGYQKGSGQECHRSHWGRQLPTSLSSFNTLSFVFTFTKQLLL